MDWQEAEAAYDDDVIGMSTIPRLFEEAVQRHGDREAQRYKGGIYDRSLAGPVLDPAPDGEFASITYDEMGTIVRNLAAGFRDLGVESDSRVAIFADTRMEWAHCDFAVLSAGGVVTTVYTSSSVDQVGYLIDDPDADGVVVENAELLDRTLTAAEKDDLDLEFVVVIDECDAVDDHDDVYSLAEIHDRGADAFDPEVYEAWLDERDVDDLASLIYTSGTTGRPKGVKLTHRNFRANVNQCRRRFGPRPDRSDDVPVLDETSRSVSYLPLAHVFERLGGHFLMFASGATVAYADSPDTLKEDFGIVQPTTATSVPRVYEKMYDAIREQASESDLKERIFEWAIEVGREYHDADNPGSVLRAKRAAADRLVFSNVRDALGGNVEFLISGGGSLSADLCALYHAMGLPILEGYGLTETSPVITVNPPENPKVGTIGPPVHGIETKLDRTVAAEGEITDSIGEVGELLVRGPNVTDGYWNNPGATERAFTDDGWFRTGDVVQRRPDEYLVFHERAKQIMVLSTGKNVAPGPIEDAFAASDVVEQCMVIGEERKFVSALIVPNVDGVRSWGDSEGIDLPDDSEEICADERVRERIETEVETINEGFEPHERIGDFRLIPIEFTEENELLTPTMKKKRRSILDAFAEEVDDIYAAAEEEATVD